MKKPLFLTTFEKQRVEHVAAQLLVGASLARVCPACLCGGPVSAISAFCVAMMGNTKEGSGMPTPTNARAHTHTHHRERQPNPPPHWRG